MDGGGAHWQAFVWIRSVFFNFGWTLKSFRGIKNKHLLMSKPHSRISMVRPTTPWCFCLTFQVIRTCSQDQNHCIRGVLKCLPSHTLDSYMSQSLASYNQCQIICRKQTKLSNIFHQMTFLTVHQYLPYYSGSCSHVTGVNLLRNIIYSIPYKHLRFIKEVRHYYMYFTEEDVTT